MRTRTHVCKCVGTHTHMHTHAHIQCAAARKQAEEEAAAAGDELARLRQIEHLHKSCDDSMHILRRKVASTRTRASTHAPTNAPTHAHARTRTRTQVGTHTLAHTRTRIHTCARARRRTCPARPRWWASEQVRSMDMSLTRTPPRARRHAHTHTMHTRMCTTSSEGAQWGLMGAQEELSRR
jgi:hypothetical protein